MPKFFIWPLIVVGRLCRELHCVGVRHRIRLTCRTQTGKNCPGIEFVVTFGKRAWQIDNLWVFCTRKVFLGFPTVLELLRQFTTHFRRCKIRSVDKIFAFLSSHLSLPLRRTNTGRNRIELGSPKGMQTVTFKMPNRRYAARKTCLPSFHNSCSPFSALLNRHVNKLIPL